MDTVHPSGRTLRRDLPSNEVQLEPGWVLRDVRNASAPVAYWSTPRIVDNADVDRALAESIARSRPSLWQRLRAWWGR